MPRLTFICVLIAALGTSIAASAAAGSVAPTPLEACDHLLEDHDPVTRSVALDAGHDLVVVDRYGGYLARYVHGAAQFTPLVRQGRRLLSARPSAAFLGPVRVSIDSGPGRAPFYPRNLELGAHDYAITAKGVTLHVPFTVGNCGTAFGFASAFRPATLAVAALSANNERGGVPALRTVTFRARRGKALPPSARGRRVGTLYVDGRRLALRARRRGATLLRAGRLRVVAHAGAVTVSGLPSGASDVQLRLSGAARALLSDPRDAVLSGVAGDRVTVTLR